MTANKERWMLFSAFILTVLFSTFFILPNYQEAGLSSVESFALEERIQQLERRQSQVNALRSDINDLKTQINAVCKFVPKSPDMSSIVQSLSLEVDGIQVIDQSFTAGVAPQTNDGDSFALQPLAVSMKADFNSIYSIIQNVESLNRLVRVASVKMMRRERESDIEQPFLEAAIGLHALYEPEEDQTR